MGWSEIPSSWFWLRGVGVSLSRRASWSGWGERLGIHSLCPALTLLLEHHYSGLLAVAWFWDIVNLPACLFFGSFETELKWCKKYLCPQWFLSEPPRLRNPSRLPSCMPRGVWAQTEPREGALWSCLQLLNCQFLFLAELCSCSVMLRTTLLSLLFSATFYCPSPSCLPWLTGQND